MNKSANLVYILYIYIYIYILYKAEKPSVCMSIRLHFWHADNSAVFASAKTELARNESCVFKEYKVCFYKPIELTIYQQECVKGNGVSSH